MKDFILKMYSNDNFTLYLTIALVVLIILFFIVLFFGKKDKKLQETQKLQKINDTFKEEKKEAKLEIEAPEEPKALPEQVKDEPEIKEEATVIAEPKEEKVNMTTVEPDLSHIVEEKQNDFEEINDSLEKELTELENLKREFNDIEIPQKEEKQEEVEIKEEVKEEKAKPQVFSSVFVDKPIEDDFELPTLKEDVKKETEPVKEDSEIKTFSFDDISGETYDLDKK